MTKAALFSKQWQWTVRCFELFIRSTRYFVKPISLCSYRYLISTRLFQNLATRTLFQLPRETNYQIGWSHRTPRCFKQKWHACRQKGTSSLATGQCCQFFFEITRVVSSIFQMSGHDNVNMTLPHPSSRRSAGGWLEESTWLTGARAQVC